MRSWLDEAVNNGHQSMSEDCLGHYLGRGLPKFLALSMKVGEWFLPETPAPDKEFVQEQGPHGEKVQGWLSIPVWAPSGKILGVEFRTWKSEKRVRKYYLQDSLWIPTFVGLVPESLEKISKGGNVWLVEGIFDLTIGHVIPERDVVLGCGGAKISDSQLDFLVRFLKSEAVVNLTFDEDKTGRDHANGYTDPKTGRYVRGVKDRLEKAGIRVCTVRYQGGSDPGEVWDRGGRKALLEAFRT